MEKEQGKLKNELVLVKIMDEYAIGPQNGEKSDILNKTKNYMEVKTINLMQISWRERKNINCSINKKRRKNWEKYEL